MTLIGDIAVFIYTHIHTLLLPLNSSSILCTTLNP